MTKRPIGVRSDSELREGQPGEWEVVEPASVFQSLPGRPPK